MSASLPGRLVSLSTSLVVRTSRVRATSNRLICSSTSVSPLRPLRLRLQSLSHPVSAREFNSSRSALLTQLKPYLLADIGEGIRECEIIRWDVKPGSRVEEFQALCEVQSDKASVEVTSRYAGLVKKLSGEVGAIVKVGEPLCWIEVEAEEGEQRGSSTAAQTSSGLEKLDEDSGQVRVPESATPSLTAASQAISAVATAPRRPHPLDPNGKSTSQPPPAREALAIPSVRRLCKERGIDVRQVTGTGKDGRVTREDVIAFEQPEASSSSTHPTTPSSDPSATTVVSQPLTGLRKAMFRSLSLSSHIPHFTFSEEIDVTELEALRKRINATTSSNTSGPTALSNISKLTLFPFLLKALSLTLPQHPLFLSKVVSPKDWHLLSYSEQASQSQLVGPRTSHDVGFALSTSAGLHTPVLRDLQRKSVVEIAKEIATLQRKALEGRLSKEHLSPSSASGQAGTEGSTILLSNIGSIGAGTNASPVLPPTGELAMGAIGMVKRGMKWSDDPSLGLTTTLETNPIPIPRLLLPVTFAGDHRVLQGTELAAFVKEFKWWVEHPDLWIALGS